MSVDMIQSDHIPSSGEASFIIVFTSRSISFSSIIASIKTLQAVRQTKPSSM